MTTKPAASSWAVPSPPPAQPAISGLDYDALQKCIHCGFCIQACPTYRQTGMETASPRGRLALMRAVAEGILPVDEGFGAPVELCLGCRACESACPSLVPYGHLLEESRELAAAVVPPPWAVRFALRHLMAYPRRLAALAILARLAQRLGLFRWLPGAMGGLARALPSIERQVAYATVSGAAPVLFFTGCVQEAFLQPQNLAAVRVLAAAGGAVAVPAGQTCCGALHAHSGDLAGARELAKRNIEVFEHLPGLIVNHAGGCGAQLKEYGRLLADDPAWAGRAARFSARVRDLSEWLVTAGLPAGSALSEPARVTYQDSCHLAHGQKVRQQPRALIRAISGVTYREMADADQCCGSAGIYNLLQAEMSARVLKEKMGNVAATEATILVTANPGCYLQVRQGVARHGLSDHVRVVDLAELLDAALPGRPPG